MNQQMISKLVDQVFLEILNYLPRVLASLLLLLVGCAALIRSRDYYLPTLVLVPLGFFMFTGSGHVPGDPYGMDVYYSIAFLPFAMIAACCAGQIFVSARSRRKPGGGSR